MKDKYPKAWADFEEWLEKTNYGMLTGCMECGYLDFVGKYFESLPFEMQLGVYLKYFDEKEIFIGWQTNNFKDAIEQAFEIREVQL